MKAVIKPTTLSWSWTLDRNISGYMYKPKPIKPGFLKRWLLKICLFSPEQHQNRGFITLDSLEATRKKIEGRGGGEGGEEKKDFWQS